MPRGVRTPRIGVVEHAIDCRSEGMHVAGREHLTAPHSAHDFAAAAVVGDDDRRAAQQRLEWHQSENLVLGRVDDDVRVRERLEPIPSGEKAGPNRVLAAAERTWRRRCPRQQAVRPDAQCARTHEPADPPAFSA